jgi:hypothetical protein
MNDNLLIENAVLAFLHNYPEHKLKEDYLILLDKVRGMKDELADAPEVRKRGRPAKRQRTKEAASNTSSKEED